MSHECKHEGNIAELKTSMKKVEEDVGFIKRKLTGNGEDGLITDVALLKKAIGDIPGPKILAAYSMIGGGSVMFITLIGYWAFKTITGA